MDAVDEAHGLHVVDPGIEADLVEEDDAGGPGFGIEALHGLADVGRRDHGFAVADAGPGHGRMEDVRDEADDHVGAGDFRIQRLLVLEIEAEGGSTGMTAGQGGRFLRFEISDPDADVGSVEKIPDDRAGHETGTEDEKGFNGRPP